MYRYSYVLPIILPNCETNDAIIYHKNLDYHHPNYRIKSTIFFISIPNRGVSKSKT